MDPGRWNQISEVFHRVLKADPGERERLLSDACAGDEALRCVVSDLLHHDGEAQRAGFLESGSFAAAGSPPAVALPAGIAPGARLGPYELHECIGCGGMASVFRAVRVDDFHAVVAIKFNHQRFDSEELDRRARIERQVLAGFTHPNIARLLDGGSTEGGLPYLVMEYVPGQPLHDWCDSGQLTTGERLQLFLKVCRAIACAHDHGVVHRDLKPHNVLVTAEGTPKVIDFGVAKAFEARGDAEADWHTRTGEMVGSAGYMAPEQIKGLSSGIGPAADVHALGALLYRLLCGRPPYWGESAIGTLLMTLEQEPTPPRRFHPGLACDVETICLKCLEKSPGQRYADGRWLAEDVERHLTGRPILARPSSRTERLVRWCRRRPLVASLAFALALVSAGSVAMFASARSARSETQRQRDNAVAAVNLVRQALDGLLTELAGRRLENHPGMQPLRKELLERAATIYAGIVELDTGDPTIQFGAALAQLRFGEILYRLGEDERGVAEVREAVNRLETLAKDAPADVPSRLECSASLGVLARLLREGPEKDEAVGLARRSVTIADELVATDSSRVDLQINQALQAYNLGRTLEANHNDQEAQHWNGLALQLHESLARRFPDDADRQEPLGFNLAIVARGLWDANHRVDALPLYRQAVAVEGWLKERFPYEPRRRRNLQGAVRDLGNLMLIEGRFDEAERLLRRRLDTATELASAEPTDIGFMLHLAGGLEDYARVLRALGRRNEAERTLRRAIEVQEGAFEKTSRRTGHRPVIAGMLLCSESPAAEDIDRAARLAQAEVDELHPHTSGFDNLVLGESFCRLGRYREALEHLAVAAEKRPEHKGVALLLCALAHAKLGETGAARLDLEAGRTWMEQNAPFHPDLVRIRSEAEDCLPSH